MTESRSNILNTLEELQRHMARMEVLYEASRAFAEEVGDPDALLHTVARACSRVVGDFSAVTLVRTDLPEWIAHSSVCHPDPDVEREYAALAASTSVRLGEGVAGKVILSGQPILLPEVDPEEIVARAPKAYREVSRRLNVHSLVVVPMHARGKIIGCVSMARSRPGVSYTPADVTYLQDLADRAALALDNAQLYRDLERRVVAATARIENANRELEAFSYSVAHDLRAPLRAIDGFSRMIEEDNGAQLDDDGRSHLKVVRESTQRMAELIDGLLLLAHVSRQELQLQEVDLAVLVRECVARLRTSDASRVVDVRVPEELQCTGDRRLLDLVVTNLVGNAWKYSRQREHARIEVGREEGEGVTTYFVRDDGAGFDAAQMDRLFSPFQRLHRADEFEGTGIGLATVKRAITRHGGRIWAESDVGRGATFFFTLA